MARELREGARFQQRVVAGVPTHLFPPPPFLSPSPLHPSRIPARPPLSPALPLSVFHFVLPLAVLLHRHHHLDVTRRAPSPALSFHRHTHTRCY